MAGATIGTDKTMAIAVDAKTLVAADAGPLGVADARIKTARRPFALQGDLDRLLRRNIPGMSQIKIGDLLRHQRRIGETGIFILSGVTGDAASRRHRIANGVTTKIGGAGRTLALTDIDCHPQPFI